MGESETFNGGRREWMKMQGVNPSKEEDMKI
jgi:hypothetical protein